MKSIFSIINSVIIIFFLASTVSFAIVKCVGSDGDVIYRDSTCPTGYRVEKDFSCENDVMQKQKLHQKIRTMKKKKTNDMYNRNKKNDIDKLTSYAVILGRACACGIDVGSASRKVGAWIDKKFPPGSSDQMFYLNLFMKGMEHHAKQQSVGNSPDTCSQVRSAFYGMQWP